MEAQVMPRRDLPWARAVLPRVLVPLGEVLGTAR